MNLTLSYAQTGKQNPDTVRCYTYTELVYIAATLVEARACDTLLSISTAKLANRDSLIIEQVNEIVNLNNQLELKDKIIDIKEDTIAKLTEDLRKESLKLKWTKVGWVVTSALASGLIIYLL